MNSILLIEDEVNVRKSLENYLQREGFTVRSVENLRDANGGVTACDLIVLDWMLPDGQGIESLKQWRGRGINTPVIMLTARADLVDKVLGLELGANDYLTKPFEPRELVARIRVQLRRREDTSKKLKLESSGLSLNLATYEASYFETRLDLTKTEFELLKVFIENPQQVFSREELLKKVWGYNQYPTTRTVDTHVLQLRQKTRPDFFETVHGIGYRFRAQEK